MHELAIKKVGILRVIAQLFFMGRSLSEKHPAKDPSMGREALIVSSLGFGGALWMREKHMDKIMEGNAHTKAVVTDTNMLFQHYADNPLKGAQAIVIQPDPSDHAALMMDIH